MSKGRYGSPRITKELNANGVRVLRPRIARLMSRNGVKRIMKRKYRVTTNSNHLYPVNENLLLRDFSTTSTGEKWVSDITYIRTGEGWLYLTMVMDLADRKIKHKLPKMSLLFCCNSIILAYFRWLPNG